MLLLPLLAFVFGSLLIGAAAFALIPGRAAVIDRRIEELTTGRVTEDEVKPKLQSLRRLHQARR